MMEWIKCSERKPDADGRFLVSSTYGIVMAYFSVSWSGKFQDAGTNNDEGMEDWDGNVFHVTHWMPLPPPPTE